MWCYRLAPGRPFFGKGNGVVHHREESGAWILWEVHDTGIGIAEADVAKAMAKLCGGVLRMHVQAQPKRSVPLYFARRQYSFDFSV